jgi:hypothetical protein
MRKFSLVLGAVGFIAMLSGGLLIEGIIVMVIAFALYGYTQRGEQAGREQEISDLAKDVEEGKERWFYLYLRPFALTSKLPVRNPEYKTFRRENLLKSVLPGQQRVDLENIIAHSLNAAGINFLALGRPGEALGAGRISTSDENWKEKFELYAKAADGIVMIPSTHPGTLWELKRLVEENYLDKVIFVHPRQYQSRDWMKVKQEAAGFGLVLPDGSSQGQMFKILSSGHVESAPIPGWHPGGTHIHSLRKTTAPR